MSRINENINLDKIKKVHFIGIGGIGVSAVAKLMLKLGKIVSGSDACDSEIVVELRKMGAVIFIGSDKRHIKKDMDLVVYSSAVPENNSERMLAKKLGIKQISYPEFLGFLSRQMRTIAISGTNGKSTTTAMLGLILEKAGLDPTVILGSKVKSFENGNLRMGAVLMRGKIPPTPPLGKGGITSPSFEEGARGRLFIVEGCEYKAAMLELSPKMIVLTNIEEDHLDFYKNLAHIKRTFKKYVEKVERDGVLVYNADDRNSADVLKGYRGKKVGYSVEQISNFKFQISNFGDTHLIPRHAMKGISKKGTSGVVAKNVRVKNQRQSFEIWDNFEGEVYKPRLLGEIKLKIPGIFNVYNAMAAVSASLTLGVDFKIIKKSLEEFTGIWRRFEIVGEYNGATIISDYAHHPTAIQGTIKAAREFYSKRRIIAVFQPHSHNRTRKLFTEFAKSFNDADLVILSEVYDVEGRENPGDKVSSRELAEVVQEYCKLKPPLPPFGKGGNKIKYVFYAKNLKECEKILYRNIKKDDIVLIMGAGDIYKLKI